jgi:integrase
MPALTALSVKNYRPQKKPQKKRREIADSKAVGLFLIVQPSGKKSWAVRLRRPDGRSAKLTLGVVDLADKETADEPTLGAPLSLAQARQLAASIARERARGVDVVAKYQTDKARQRDAAATASADAFVACVREFFIDHKTKRQTRPRRWREDAAVLGLKYPLGSNPAVTAPGIIKGGLADVWRDKLVTQIDSHDIHSVVTEARKHGSDGRARKLFAALSVLFSWLQKHRRVVANPCGGVFRPGPPPSRERVLSDGEIVAFWRATDRLSAPAGALCKLLLCTGCRLREASGMRHAAELGKDGEWTIPGNRTKNGRSLSLTLPRLALDIIASVPVIEGEAGFVFTINGNTPITNFSGLKRQLDEEMTKIAGKPVTPFRLHDLRRTTATGLASLGVALPVIEKILNHVSGSFGGIVSVYQKHEFKTEKAEALARWAQHLQGLVAGQANVITMKKAPR